MTFSPLINRTIPHLNRYNPRQSSISGFTIHHNAGVNSIGEASNPNREVSANYWILDDGTLIGNIPEEFRAWTSGVTGYPEGAKSDHRNITVEVSNTTAGVRDKTWAISDAALNTLVRLIADVFKRYRLGTIKRATYGGVAVHRDFVPTECPGPYIMSKLADIISNANRLNSGGSTPAPAPSGKTYKVIKNDTLSGIGQKTGVKWQTIASLNGIKAPYTIFPGQVLKLTGSAPAPTPAAKTYTVQKNDSLSVIGERTGTSWQAIASLNGIKAPYVIYAGQKLNLPAGGSTPKPAPAPSSPLHRIIHLPVGWYVYTTAQGAKTMNRAQRGMTISGAYQITRMVDGVPCLGRNGVDTGWVHPSVLTSGYRLT